MKNQFICPICHGTVMPLPYSREPLADVVQRHMQQMHGQKDGWGPLERFDETTQKWVVA